MQWNDPSPDKNFFHVCDVGLKPTNWLVTDEINTKNALRLNIELSYTMRNCPDCKTEFYLYVHHSATKKKADPTKVNFTLISTVTPAVKPVVENYEYTFNTSVAAEHPFVYFAFLDKGACMVLKRVKVSYNYCGAKDGGQLVSFPRRSSPYNDSSSGYVEGRCSDENSVNKTKLLAMCTSSGEWKMSDDAKCLCKPAYGFKGSKCEGTCTCIIW